MSGYRRFPRVQENRYFPNTSRKRKHEEDDQPSVYRKKPPNLGAFYSPEEPTVNSNSHTFPRSDYSALYHESSNTHFASHSKKYQANDRLARIRRSFEGPQSRSAVNQIPIRAQYNLQEISPEVSNTQVQASNFVGRDKKSSCLIKQLPTDGNGQSFVVTAKPSSLIERIEKIRSNSSKSSDSNEQDHLRISNAVPDQQYKSQSTYLKDNNSNNPKINSPQKNVSQATPSSLTDRLTNIRSVMDENRFFDGCQQDYLKAAVTSQQEHARDSVCHQNNSSHKSTYHQVRSQDVTSDNQNLTDDHLQSSTVCTNIINPDVIRRRSASMDESSCMDWSYIEEREVLQNIQELRKESVSLPEQTLFQEIVANSAFEIPVNTTILKDIYIIVDTNIFISHLDIVKQLMDIKVNGIHPPFIYIPWIVIQELDYIKDDRAKTKLKQKAQAAVHFINSHINKDSLLKGQTVREAALQDFESKSADDGILYCCLQIKEKHNRPMLLSNDVNLRNKAEISGVAAYSHSQILYILDPFAQNVVQNSSTSKEMYKVKQLEMYMSQLLNDLMFEELEDSYGVGWSKMKLSLKTPPWLLKYCIEMFKKFWQPVFSMSLQKHCLTAIEKLGQQKIRGPVTEQDLEQLVEQYLGVCVFLKTGYSRHVQKIEKCINYIQNIGDTLNKS